MPPVQFLVVAEAIFLQQLTDPKSSEDERRRLIRLTLLQALQGIDVEMVIVVVTDENDIDWRQVVELHSRCPNPAWSGK